MPRGQPDYGLYAAKESSASISDMGEVAARLGSIITYDKRGDVIDFDNFENAVLKWAVSISGVGGYARLDSTSVRSANQSVKLYTPATKDAYVELKRGYSIGRTKRLGIEVSISTLGTYSIFLLTLLYTTATTKQTAKLKLDNELYELYIMTGNEIYTKIDTLYEIFATEHWFNTMKVVADFESSEYVRLMFDNNEYDISALSPYLVSPWFGAPYIQLELKILNKEDLEGVCYIDDVVLTQAEP